MKPTNYEYRDPAELTIHSAIKSQPRLPQDHPTMQAMRKGMKRSGPDSREILITNENEIVDGRHWFWNAKALQWDKVRVRVIGADEVVTTLMETLLNRRHYTKGQLAYCLAEHIGDAFEEAKRRMLVGAADPRNSVSRVKTPDEYAAEIGVSVQYLRQARELHELFKAHPEKRTFTDDDGKKHKDVTLREYFEARILSDEKPVGLGAALAGIGAIYNSVRKTGGKPQDENRQFQLFNQLLSDENTRWEYWQKFDDELKAEHFQDVRAKAALLAPEVCAERAEYHEKLAEQFRKAAKAGKDGK